MVFSENHAAFHADFGVTAKIGTETLTGIFDNAEQDSFNLVAQRATVLNIADADAPLVAVGDTVVVGSMNYTVTELQPDGTGRTRVMLK